jgi:hypothetical protein
MISRVNRLAVGLCLTLLLIINCNLANAESSEQYAVNDVVANASGKSPSQARINAIAAAQRNAFLILLNRLGMDEDIAANFKDETIADMVSSQQILNEKIAGNNYSATLNLTFSESFVKHYLAPNLKAEDVKDKDDNKAKTYLILPVKVVKNQMLIWETDNDWKTAIDNNLQAKAISSVKMIKGDVGDIAAFNSDSILSGNFTDFEPILNKYKVDALMVAYYDYDSLENKVNITLKNIQRFQTNQIRLDFVNVNQLPISDLVNKVADKTTAYIAGTIEAKANPSKPSPTISSYQIDVLVANLDNWLTVKNKLENSNLVSQFKVESISRDLVKINVAYNNINGDIVTFFAKSNLFLQKKSEGGYILSLSPMNKNQ